MMEKDFSKVGYTLIISQKIIKFINPKNKKNEKKHYCSYSIYFNLFDK